MKKESSIFNQSYNNPRRTVFSQPRMKENHASQPKSGIPDKKSDVPSDRPLREKSTLVVGVNTPLIEGLLPSSNDVKEKLNDSLSVLVSYLEIFGFDSKSFNRKSTLDHWQLCSAKCGWIKFLKYKLSAFFSMFLKEEVPPCPFDTLDNPLHLTGGTAGRFVTYFLNRTKDPVQRYGFAFGLLNLKKGFPRPGADLLEKAKKDTLKVLTTTHPIPKSEVFITDYNNSWDEPRREIVLADLIQEVKRTVREVFRKQRFTDEHKYKPYVPSIRAAYTSSRSKFGTYGDLIRLMMIVDEEKDASFYADAFYLDRASETDERIEDEIPTYVLRADFVDEFNQKYLKLYDRVLDLAQQEEANTTLVALAEALKVRIISKGPPLTYFVLKPVQKFMHKIMRHQRCFKLIGTPVTAEILDDTYKGLDGDFLSVDYASATDLLNPVLSKVCVNEICQVTGIPSNLRGLFEKALTGHTVEGLPQMWGQLMGSIVSFPILCLINAAICRFSFELGENKQWTNLNEIPLLVNGDDGLLRCNKSTKFFWERLSALGGLTPSVGKVYFSKEYMNINSTSFILKNDSIVHVPYINMGLVKGMTRSDGKVGVDSVADSLQSSFGTIGSRHRELIDSVPNGLKLKVHKLFIHENYTVLKSVKVPWYVPENLGGVGLKPFTVYTGDDVDEFKYSYLEENGVRYGPSDLDLKICRILLNKYQDKSCNVSKLPTLQPVQARQVWYNNKGFDIPRIHTIMKPASQLVQCAVSQERVSSFLDMTTFYYCPSLVTRVVEKSLDSLRRNERAWSKLLITAVSTPGLPGFDYLHGVKDYKLAYFVHE